MACRSLSESSVRKRCYYAILDVPATASAEEIRAAYYTKCKTTHPDVSPTDPHAFLVINEAYSTLIDPDQRRLYDENRGIVQKHHDDDSLSPYFSYTPYGPKVSFSRASEIFHSRSFRRKYAALGCTWWEPVTKPLRKDVKRKFNPFDDLYNRRSSERYYSPPTSFLLGLLFAVVSVVLVAHRS